MQLRLIGLDDDITPRIHQLLCVPDVYEYLADGEQPPRSVAETWVALSQADWRDYGGGLWVLQSADYPNRLLGLTRLSSYENRQLELTYLLHPGQWRSGWATRMAHTVMEACFRRGEVDTIWAGADMPNVRSIAVMGRLGLTFRRHVDYPAGRGVEYAMSVHDFNPCRFEPLPVVD